MAKLTNIDAEVSRGNFFKFDSIGDFVVNIFQVALILGSVMTFLYLVWGGIQWITSGGNQEAAKSAKEKITDAITGLALLAAVWVIWRLIIYFLGITTSVRGPFNLRLPQP
ncbi:MAG: hypothetical protein UW37_C0046G0008 [Candidatus Gottesmanbacteria bacterium GW2011_GWA2_44_17]|uniref:Uncharacterized protein n=1 Tax=Candidatus Gottesmanbacteria bacterium GW2011_GWA2_44_17 TaxID=1618444 RepID=A0A0G1KCF9_9BACT|nr:MAG: hypothetical protein UW37_C0046G0008 [Candidatus Gottesmanbacteria bacterium GW2011_GWA2_44_17]